jgi:P2 family phage contractile tail tube protein
MSLPEFLNDFRVYKNGQQLGVADLQLPSLEAMTQTVSGAGVAGEYDSPVLGHFQSMKLTMNWKTVNQDMSKLSVPNAQFYDCRGANQFNDNGTQKIEPVRVVVQGFTVKNDLGKFQKGNPSDGSTDIEVVYLKIQVNNQDLVELDKINYKFIVDGVDYLQDVRKSLGL